MSLLSKFLGCLFCFEPFVLKRDVFNEKHNFENLHGEMSFLVSFYFSSPWHLSFICHSFYLSYKLRSTKRNKKSFCLKKGIWNFTKYAGITAFHAYLITIIKTGGWRKKIRLWYLGTAGVGRRVLTPSVNGYEMLCGRFPPRSQVTWGPKHALSKLWGASTCPW